MIRVHNDGIELEFDDGNEPSVGLPRKEESTSVILIRLAAYQLDSHTPYLELPNFFE